jgi:two-component system cell cycle response regulator DivK
MTTVLIIEDDEKSRRLLSDVQSLHGYRILQTDRAEEGVALLDATDDVSLVLMDIQLPGISGFEALARIRASTSRAATKVVAVTASVMDTDRRRILDAGFDAYMPKPVSLKDLLGTVRAMAG